MWKGERNIQTFYVPSTSLERSQSMSLRTCAIIWTIFRNEKLRTTGSGNNLIRLKAHKSCSRKYIFCATFPIDVEEKEEESPPNHLKYFLLLLLVYRGVAAFSGWSTLCPKMASWKIDDERTTLVLLLLVGKNNYPIINVRWIDITTI